MKRILVINPGSTSTKVSLFEDERAAFERAIVTAPDIVLADEPTGNLDAMAGSEILRMLSDLSAGSSMALVMVTHSPEAAAICDRVLTLEDGVLK